MVFVKGHPKYGGKQKGTKNKETLLKEERRAIFDAEVSAIWLDTISRLKPEYVADQFMGKPTERIEVEVTDKPSAKVQELIDAYTHRRGKTTTN